MSVTTGLCVPFGFTDANVVVDATASSTTPDPNPNNSTATASLLTILEGFGNGFDCP